MPSNSSAPNSKQNRSAWLSPQTLFKVAAVFNINAIWGHTLNGFIAVYPAVRAIPPLPQHAVGQSNARLGWNFMNAFFIVSALQNWQWSKTNGPRTTEERWMIWGTLLLGIPMGFSCFEKAAYGPAFAAYGPLTVLWFAPLCSAVGVLLS